MIRHLLLRLRVWMSDAHGSSPALERTLARCCQYVLALLRDLAAGELSMRAMSLVYTTLLSIVPLLALSFSVLKALGADSLEPVLAQMLAPLGPRAAEVSTRLSGFVERVQVGVLGSLGIALLFYTAISLVQKVESSFDYIWRVRRRRAMGRRLGEYFGVLLVGPVLIFSALGISATLLNSDAAHRLADIEPFGELMYWGTRLTPYALIVGVFTFLYRFIPNTPVRLHAAFAGGLMAGILWHAGSLLFASFVARVINFDALYSGFGILFVLLIWLHLAWLILLTGCQLSYYVQNPRELLPPAAAGADGRLLEQLGLLAMACIARRFLAGEAAWEAGALATRINTEPETLARALQRLVDAGLVAETGNDGTSLLPARDLDTISVAEVWRSLRGTVPELLADDALAAGVYTLLQGLDLAFESGDGGLSLRAWLARETCGLERCQNAVPAAAV